MRFLLALAVASSALAADQALSVPTSATVTCTVPNAAPFTAMGDNRLVMRIHITTFPASTAMVLDCNKVAIQLQAGGIVNAINRGDTMSGRGNVQSVTTSGNGADVTIRFQRFGSAYPTSEANIVPGSIQLDVIDNVANAVLPSWCGSPTAPANMFGCEINAAIPYDAHGSNGAGGSATAAFEIPYIKWYSTNVPPGTPISETATSALADLADFSFDSNAPANLGTLCTAVTPVCVSLSLSGTSYTGAQVQSPICQLTRQTFRAGVPATLSSVSYPLNGDAAITSQIWQQLAGAPLLFSSNLAASPTVTGGVAGGVSPVFQLTVSDSAGRSRTCSVKDGFVATDGKGVITSGNAQIDSLIGTPLRMGLSPVSYVDDTQGRLQIFHRGLTQSVYGGNASAYWRNAGPGTIKVTQGSAAVVGTGTTFTTTFCQGPGSPTLPKTPTTQIEVWYQTSTAIIPSGIGRRLMPVASCTDDTHLTMGGSLPTWNSLDSSRLQPNAGAQSGPLNYNYSDNENGSGFNEVWIAQQSQAGFYDTILARYIAAYRTGIDDDLNDARQFALNVIQHKLDYANNYIFGESRQSPDIYWSPLGVALYALDGHPEIWPVVEQFAAFCHSDVSRYFPLSENNMVVGDARDMTYHIAGEVAATFSPNSYADTARSNLNTLMGPTGIGATADLSGGTTPVFGQAFYHLNDGGGHNGSNAWESSSSVDLTNGSTTGTCHAGTTCAFDPTWFGVTTTTTGSASSGSFFLTLPSTSGLGQGQLITGAGIPANTYIAQVTICSGSVPCVNMTRATTAPLSSTSVTFQWMYSWGFSSGCSTPTTCAKPTNNNAFVGGVYYPTYGSATTFTLDRPFTGPSGTHQYGWTPGHLGNSNPVVGIGSQPYEDGMIAFSFDLARQRLTCTGTNIPANCNSTTATAILGYENSVISFVQNHGYNATLKAPYYFAGFLNNCLTSPASDLDGACHQAFSAPAARFDSGPLMRGISNVLLASYPNSGLQAFGDFLSAAEFGRPGFSVMGGQTTDAGYASDYLDAPLGGFFGTPPGQVDKGFGAAFGMGNVPGFMGARLGGLTASSTTTINVGLSFPAGAVTAIITDTEPDGRVIPSSPCSSPSCPVTITTGYGVHNLTWVYKNAGGSVIASTTQPIVTAQ